MDAIVSDMLVYVAAHAGDGQGGIHLLRMNRLGELQNADLVAPVSRALFLVCDQTNQRIYASGERPGAFASTTGLVTAWVRESSGSLRPLGEQATPGTTPCYLACDPSGRFLVVAHFRGPGDVGSVTVLPVGLDGRPGVPCDQVHWAGSSIHPTRQLCSHPHCVRFNPEGSQVLVADLGTDTLSACRFDAQAGRLAHSIIATCKLAPGSGPRHFVFHPSDRYVYLVNEIANTVLVLTFEPDGVGLKLVQSLTCLPADIAGGSAAADLVLAPDGRFLYISNRGHDSIAIFAVVEGGRAITLVGHQPGGGRNPRSLACAPDGRFLLVANQDSNLINVFRINPEDGRLSPAGSPAHVPAPVCIIMMRAEGAFA